MYIHSSVYTQVHIYIYISIAVLEAAPEIVQIDDNLVPDSSKSVPWHVREQIDLYGNRI
jgi:hypothetical protein